MSRTAARELPMQLWLLIASCLRPACELDTHRFKPEFAFPRKQHFQTWTTTAGFLGAADSHATGMEDDLWTSWKCKRVTERITSDCRSLSVRRAQVGDSQMLRARELFMPAAPSLEGCTGMV